MDSFGWTFRWLQWGVGRLCVLMGLLASMCIVTITLASLAEVFYRYLLGRSFLGVIELVEMLMAFVFFGLMSYTQYLKGHLRLTLFTDRLPERSALPLEAFVLLLVLIFVSLMTWQASDEAVRATTQNEIRFGAIEYPLWPGKIAGAAAMIVLSLQLFIDLIDRLIAIVSGASPAQPMGQAASEADSV